MLAEITKLGLTPYFTNQLTADELTGDRLVRIIEVHRSGMIASNGTLEFSVRLGGTWFQLSAEERPTVGDWVLLDNNAETVSRVLERSSVFKRIASGQNVDVQLIAANIDTLFIVTSCNEEFNESRLERYLSLAIEAGVTPVVVLSKVDLITDPDRYIDRVRTISSTVPVEAINALDESTLSGLREWINAGDTIALVGSSGVGKSSIVNSLSGKTVMNVGKIREQDAKGRHTTTHRALHQLDSGGLLLDVPGMRELKVVDVETALTDLFDDIEALASRCKFRDCLHEQEPGCAVQAAIVAGDLDMRRLINYRKLEKENARMSATVAEVRERDRKFSKKIKTVISDKQRSRPT